jgi:hypothetical protein
MVIRWAGSLSFRFAGCRNLVGALLRDTGEW